MFCILTGTMNLEELSFVLMQLSYQPVQTRIFSDGDNLESTYMVVDDLPGEEERQGAYYARLSMVMTLNQVGNICPHCVDKDPCRNCDIHGQCDNVRQDCGGMENVCGHITYGRSINSEAFDLAVLRDGS